MDGGLVGVGDVDGGVDVCDNLNEEKIWGWGVDVEVEVEGGGAVGG